jgi:hypothetical protein
MYGKIKELKVVLHIKSQALMKSRIDYMIISKQIYKYLNDIKIKNTPVSNHKALILHLYKRAIQLGSG